MVDDIDKRIIDDLMAEEESLRFDDWLKEYKAKYPNSLLKIYHTIYLSD